MTKRRNPLLEFKIQQWKDASVKKVKKVLQSTEYLNFCDSLILIIEC